MTKPENVKCPECDGEMVSRTGKYGVFWGCKKFPECKGTRDSQGRSKADREMEKVNKEIDKDDKDSAMSGFSFNKKSDPIWKQMK